MLDISHLNTWYGESHVLHDVNLAVSSEGRVAILGRNGAGKTTLFKSIMNGGPRVTGSIAWRGSALGDLPSYRRARAGLAIVPEDPALLQERAEAALLLKDPAAAEALARRAYALGAKVGPLCRRHWTTVRQTRLLAGDAAGAAQALTQVEACKVAGPNRF